MTKKIKINLQVSNLVCIFAEGNNNNNGNFATNKLKIMKSTVTTLQTWINSLNKEQKNVYSYYMEANMYTLYMNEHRISTALSLKEAINCIDTIRTMMYISKEY